MGREAVSSFSGAGGDAAGSGRSDRNGSNLGGGVGVGNRGSILVCDHGGGLRKSEEGLGGTGVVFEVMKGSGDGEDFMVLYCDNVDDGGDSAEGGGGFLRVISLKNFAVVDEYDCDVAVTKMFIHGMCVASPLRNKHV